jgi:hypothetical protein
MSPFYLICRNMEIRNASAGKDNLEEQIIYYKGKSLSELHTIVPRWAYGDNADKIRDRGISAEQDRYIICMTDVGKLIQCADFGEVERMLLFTDELLNDGRVARMLHRWEQLQYIDPPTIYITEGIDHRLVFVDGRHRTKVAYLIGSLQIPVAVEPGDVEIMKTMIPLWVI